MKTAPKVRTKSRPIRVAYLIEDGIDSHGWLDAIFNSSFGRHGGRHTLVVPIENNIILPLYAEWLRTLDPDYVFTLTYDNDALVKSLTNILADTPIIERRRMRDIPEPNPRLSIDPSALTSLSWLPFLKATSGGVRQRPDHILDSFPRWEDNGLITDNFGTLSKSLQQFPYTKSYPIM